jgi:hypothetical protein
MTIAQLFYKIFVSFMIIIVLLSGIMYFFVRKIKPADFIVFASVESVIIILAVLLYYRTKKGNIYENPAGKTCDFVLRNQMDSAASFGVSL